MKVNEKIQELRRQKGLTQEQLAKKLFVSRTAVSKWESGRGIPSIESLKNISELFSVSIDELLSGEELLNIAENDKRQKTNQYREMFFALLDISVILLVYLPLFAQKTNDKVTALPLLALDAVSPYLKTLYIVFVSAIVLVGVLTLALQNLQSPRWLRLKTTVSLALNVLLAVLFVLGLHPYAAIFLFVLITIKVLTLLKKQ